MSRARQATTPEPKWLAKGERDDSDRLIANVANVLLALRENPVIATSFALDEMRRASMVLKPIPGRGGRSKDIRFGCASVHWPPCSIGRSTTSAPR